MDGKRQLVAPAAEATIAYDPRNGDELWRVMHPGGFNVSARPLYAHGLVYVFTSGLTGYLMAIDPGGKGDVTKTHIVWSTTKSTPHIPSPVVTNEGLFLVTSKGGVVRCLNPRTGEQLWIMRIGGDHWASPIYSAGKIYFSSKQGVISVLNVSDGKHDLIARNEFDGSFIASPAVAGDSIILRSTTHLYRVGD